MKDFAIKIQALPLRTELTFKSHRSMAIWANKQNRMGFRLSYEAQRVCGERGYTNSWIMYLNHEAQMISDRRRVYL